MVWMGMGCIARLWGRRRRTAAGGLYSRQCGPGFLPSAWALSRYINSPQVELQVATMSVIDFHPLCVNRRRLPPSAGSISQLSVVPTHSVLSPWHFQTTSAGGSSFSIVMRKMTLLLSKPKVALPPTASSALLSAVHHEASPADVATAA